MHYSYLSCMRYYVCTILNPLYALREAPALKLWICIKNRQTDHCKMENYKFLFYLPKLFEINNTTTNFFNSSKKYYQNLPNLTKPNLRSRAPNPAGASTHPS